MTVVSLEMMLVESNISPYQVNNFRDSVSGYYFGGT